MSKNKHFLQRAATSRRGKKEVYMNKKAKIVGMGIICLLMVIGASLYAVKFNDSRLVVPMEQPYEFTLKDLPMHIAVACMVLYVFYLCWLGCQKAKKDAAAHVTRRISPKLGIMGLLGFLGLLGFYTYNTEGRVAPFLFFMFFGFFGFFYEGKMSNTFMDERYMENKRRAQRKAHRIAQGIVYVTLFLVAMAEGRILKATDTKLIILVIAVACSIAVDIFLGEYLLYQYDHEE